MNDSKIKNKTWRKVKLGKLFLEVISGGRPPGGSLMVKEGIPSIGAEHLNENGGFDFSNLKFVPKSYYQKAKRGKIKENDILVVKDGATIGKISRVTRNFPFPEAMVNEHVFIVRGNNELVDQVFLFYKMFTREGKEMIKNSTGGSAQGGLKKDFLDYWKTYIPQDPNEQKRIAEILSAFDEKIEVNNKINKTLEEMAQAIFKEWLLKDQKSKIKNQKWRIGKLGEIMELRKDRIKRYEEWKNLKLLDLGRFPQRNLAMVSYGRGEEIKTSVFAFKKCDILFGAVRPYFHKVLIAPFNGVTNSSVFVIYPKRNIFYSFLVAVLFSNSTITYATQVASGTKMPVVKWEDLCKMPIIIPDEETIKNFDDKVKPLYKKIIQNAKENQKLAALRDLLLPKLMSGEMRV